MVRVYYGADGKVIRVDTGSVPLAPPEGVAAAPLEFDGETNEATQIQLAGRPDDFAVVNGVLVRSSDRKPVTLAPDAPANRDRKGLAAVLAKLEADQALTAPDIRLVLRHLVRRLG